MKTYSIGVFPPSRASLTFSHFVVTLLGLLQEKEEDIQLVPSGRNLTHDFISNLYPETLPSTSKKETLKIHLLDASSSMDFSSHLIVGFTSTLGDLLSARKFIGKAVMAGVPKERICLLRFETGLKRELPSSLIKEEMGNPHFVIPFEPDLLLDAEHHRAFLKDRFPRSKTVKEIQKVSTHCWEKRRESQYDQKNNNEDITQWLKETEEKCLLQFWDRVQQTNMTSSLDEKGLKDVIEKELQKILWETPRIHLSASQLESLRKRLEDHILGFGPLADFFHDSSLTEIMVNTKEDIFVEKEGKIIKSSVSFKNETQFRTVLDRMVGQVGRRVDYASPLCDLRLPDGSRANIVLPPISLQGPVLTIRRFHPDINSFADLLQRRSVTADEVELLKKLIQRRKNIVIAGNSGSGKTTLLNIMASYINEEERIITLEDTAELQLKKPHQVRFETRMSNVEGEGEINLKDLVINALRMRPDRLIIGECRGEEVIPMLQAMNTGHDGSMTTLHANSAEEVLERLESLVLMGAPHWPVEVVRQQMGSALDAIVYLKRTPTGRRLEQIVNVHLKEGKLVLDAIRDRRDV
ncbi:hypothetical protein BVX98_07685 [bacterium F11]|nr:hypothetical protein BVX98_07685 [bacterium F11]